MRYSKAVWAITAVVAVARSVFGVNWKSEVTSGAWDNAANWEGGVVPDAVTPASIENSGVDYSITLNAAGTTCATNTVIGNAEGSTVFTIHSPLSFFDFTSSSPKYYYKQNFGAKTIIGAGGAFNFLASTSDGLSSDQGLFITKSEFAVDGGKVDLRMNGHVALSGTAQQPATLTITNGGSFAWHSSDGYGQFKVPENAKVRVHDGSLAFSQNRNHYHTAPFSMTGGEMVFSGTSVFSNSYVSAEGYTSVALEIRSGKMEFHDEAVCVVQSKAGVHSDFLLIPSDAGKRVELTVTDQACFGVGVEPYLMTVGEWTPGGIAVAEFSSTEQCNLGRTTAVGAYAGYGELNLRSGLIVLGKTYGLMVGTTDNQALNRARGDNAAHQPADAATWAPTGLVRVAGANLYLSTPFVDTGYGCKGLAGFRIGDGVYARYNNKAVPAPAVGTLELSSGSITNAQGYWSIGAGDGYGRFVQTGGTLLKCDPDYPTYGGNQTMVVGFVGGRGEWVMSNGTARVIAPMMIGGAAPDDFLFADINTGWCPFSSHDAVGTLTIACADKEKPCSLEVIKANTGNTDVQGVWLGRDGTGTLEMIGSGGSLKTPYLILTNGYENASGELLTHGKAKLRFVLDEDGIASLTVSTKMAIADNAEIEVDGRAYTGETKKVKLVNVTGSRSGSFRPENIRVKGGVLIQDEDRHLYFRHMKTGLSVMLR
ncbi:MAG TPA: hypothetical protein P5125_06365 [Kiritimatiellia bacterium]|nr:hypothetical protein [Kiritimatiellia bacterium]HOR97223.1 hypothetical protein [Kiritimatiellia bacterium]HPW74982.1 hypothetical protein [Kiritimatiellia bacterium]HRU19965.1 hypothetical protein [Kiritimatiellia bacterium]